MTVSRLDKLAREFSGEASIASASQKRNQSFHVVLAEDDTGKVAVMAHAAIDLALRCFKGKIFIYLPKKIPMGIKWRGGDLKHQLLSLETLYGAQNRIEFIDSNPPSIGLVLRLGAVPGNGVIADAVGWVAGIDTTFNSLPAEVPAAVFATACAFAILFKQAITEKTAPRDSWTFCLKKIERNPAIPKTYEISPTDLGRIGLLGAGAIGGAFAYILWLSDWLANVDIIDREHYDQPNEETTLLIGLPIALRRKPKAEELSKRLSEQPNITAKPYKAEISAASPELLAHRNVFICAVDNPEVRNDLDNVNAEVLLNGAVGGSKEEAAHLMWSRHKQNDRLLSSIYGSDSTVSNEVHDDSNPPEEVREDSCSRVAYASVSMAAPFIALADAALLAAGCARHVYGEEQPINYLKFDLFGIQKRFLQQNIMRPN